MTSLIKTWLGNYADAMVHSINWRNIRLNSVLVGEMLANR